MKSTLAFSILLMTTLLFTLSSCSHSRGYGCDYGQVDPSEIKKEKKEEHKNTYLVKTKELSSC